MPCGASNARGATYKLAGLNQAKQYGTNTKEQTLYICVTASPRLQPDATRWLIELEVLTADGPERLN